MDAPDPSRHISSDIEGIDFNKLRIVVRKNLIWIIGIFIFCNLAAYLTIRWTKDVYQSESEMKLDVKQDATDLGIKTIVEDQNLNIISGEIEQIKSKVFLNRVIDSLDLWISYYSIGKVLVDEKYKYAPIKVIPLTPTAAIEDMPFYVNFTGSNSFSIKLGEDGDKINGTFHQPLTLGHFNFVVDKTKSFDPTATDDYYFVINSREALLDYLTENIAVEPLNFNANTIRIAFKDFNAVKAYTIVNAIDSLYISYSNEQKNLTNKQKIEWLNNELFQIEGKMENFENYFENFTLKNKSSDADQDLKRTIFLINKLDSQHFELNKRLSDLNNFMQALAADQTQIPLNQKQFLPDYLNKDFEALQKITVEKNRLALAYNENTFAYQQKENEFKALKDQVFGELSSLKKRWLESMAEVNSKKARLEKDFASMPDKSTQFSKNQRFYKLYEEFYLSMMQSKAQFEIAQAGNTPDFKILSHATMPSKPIAPQKLIILGIGLVAGIVFIFFFIGILYLLNNKIISIQEVERITSVPVLGSIPVIRSDGHSGILVANNPKSMVSEAIRTLRTSLDFFTAGGQKKVISISSTISGEGKSFIALNLSGVLAQSKKKVVLLDLDMRKAKDNLPFPLTDFSKGISTVLIKKHAWKDCLIKTNHDNLDFIPSGPHPPNPSELLLNGEFEQLLTELKSEYDFVVMDTPPVGLVTDGIMAMRRSDVSIYVFRANYSKREFIQSLARTIKINRLVNVAAVLNALPADGKAYGYGYYEDKKQSNSFQKLLKI